MPYAPETKRVNRSGTSAIAVHEQITDVFLFKTTYMMGEVIQTAMDAARTRGRKSAFPAALFWGLIVAERAAGSAPRLLRALEVKSTWQTISENYAAMTGGDRLPLRPPNRDQLDHFKQRLIDKRRLLDLDLLPALQEMFRRCALGQAWDHGNLLPGKECSFTRPAEEHMIYGDGTDIAPYSKVRTMADPWDPTGDRIPLGSRCKTGKPRIQSFYSDMSEDGKIARGVNMVSVHTWTAWGRIVLGTATAMRAELWPALEIIDAVAARAKDGVHSVVWDRAVTGWAVDYLMARHRIQVFGKAVARGEEKISDGANAKEEPADSPDGRSRFTLRKSMQEERARRLAVELGANRSADTIRLLRYDRLAKIHASTDPAPVGTNVYASPNGSLRASYGKTYYLTPVTHLTDDGLCRHELVVDDGSLYTVGSHPTEEYPVKEAHLPCQSSTAFKTAHGRWGRRNEYVIPCDHGAMPFTHTWEPRADRGAPDTPSPERVDPAGSELRPLARRDAEFTPFYSRRNDAESYNAWFKTTLPIHGRAASDSLRGQELDWLAAAVLNNSNTMSRRSRG